MFPEPEPLPTNYTWNQNIEISLPAIDNATQQVLDEYLNGTLSLENATALLEVLGDFYPQDLGLETTVDLPDQSGSSGGTGIFAFIQDIVQIVIMIVIIICVVAGIAMVLRMFQRPRYY
jgi:hypothetical protein